MSDEEMKFVLLTLLSLFIISFIILFLSLLYIEVLHPAYLSVVAVCRVDGEKIIEEQGFAVLGTFNATDQKITLFVEDEEVLKHELCHKDQSEKNKLFGCDHLFRKFVNEAECYVKQKF